MPGKVIVVLGTRAFGDLIQVSRVFASQLMPDAFSAGEYRSKLARLPAFRPQTPVRLGPVMFRSARREWQAAHVRNTVAPRSGSSADCAEAVRLSSATSTVGTANWKQWNTPLTRRG